MPTLHLVLLSYIFSFFLSSNIPIMRERYTTHPFQLTQRMPPMLRAYSTNVCLYHVTILRSKVESNIVTLVNYLFITTYPYTHQEYDTTPYQSFVLRCYTIYLSCYGHAPSQPLVSDTHLALYSWHEEYNPRHMDISLMYVCITSQNCFKGCSKYHNPRHSLVHYTTTLTYALPYRRIIY